MNRGSDRDDLRYNIHNKASMRPRFMNRGSLHCVATKKMVTGGFNEAPIHESGKSECSGSSPERAVLLQ